jgi:choline dehydrogenase
MMMIAVILEQELLCEFLQLSEWGRKLKPAVRCNVSLRVTRRIVAQPGLARYNPEGLKPGVEYQSDEELTRLAGDIATTIFHPVGTTKMGADNDPLAVLDARLRVRGVDNLIVVDAGAMPTITSGNTNSPTLMIAEKAAGWILERAHRSAEA